MKEANKVSESFEQMTGDNEPENKGGVSFLASSSHQSMIGLPRFAAPKTNEVKLFADFCKTPHQINVSSEHAPPFERYRRANTDVVC